MSLSTTILSTETNSSPQCHINDDIEGVTIPVDEWIAKELARIKEKQEPRHCHDYEALIEVIEEISRMPTSMMMMTTTTTTKQLNFNTDITTNNISDFNDADDDKNGSAITLPCTNDPSPILLLLPSPPVSPITSSSMMVLLGRAFISLWKYCWDDQYAPHHPYPVGLLLDIEKITLRLHSNKMNINNHSNNNNNINNNNNNNSNNNNYNNNTSINDIMNNYDTINASRKKILLPAMQGMIQAQLSKAFYIQTPTPPDATPSCLPWLASFQVIQQWIFPLSITSEKSTTLYTMNNDYTTTTTSWYSSFITGMDAYRSAKLSLPFTSHFSHLPVTSTVDHLEQLMQKTHP